MTARVLGMLAIFLTFIIDFSCFMFVKPEVRNDRFALVVIIPSLPIFAIGLFLLLRASKLPDEVPGPGEDEKPTKPRSP